MLRRLQDGAKGEDVRRWQAFLKQASFDPGNLDGDFGSQTVQATKDYQLARGVVADGVVGALTVARAIQDGFEVTADDPTLPGATMSLGNAWVAPLPADGIDLFVAIDPRVKTDHSVGQLPCPANPPPPVGWAYWTGAVSAELTAFAIEVENDPKRFPMGAFVQAVRGQQRVAARVEWHDYKGRTGERGCFRGTNLLRTVIVNN
jgi:peptidoglycan hydrolase-like protein with peptidoglycan-binding domain